jgi:hypothetical protein
LACVWVFWFVTDVMLVPDMVLVGPDGIESTEL